MSNIVFLMSFQPLSMSFKIFAIISSHFMAHLMVGTHSDFQNSYGFIILLQSSILLHSIGCCNCFLLPIFHDINMKVISRHCFSCCIYITNNIIFHAIFQKGFMASSVVPCLRGHACVTLHALCINSVAVLFAVASCHQSNRNNFSSITTVTLIDDRMSIIIGENVHEGAVRVSQRQNRYPAALMIHLTEISFANQNP